MQSKDVRLPKGLSAQFEHTVLVTDTGYEILTCGMMISKFTGVLTPLLHPPYPSYDLLTYEDNTAHDKSSSRPSPPLHKQRTR